MKPTLTNKAVHETTIKMREAGFSVRTWAESHNLPAQTVRNLLAGQYRQRNSLVCNTIRAALVKDGFLKVSL